MSRKSDKLDSQNEAIRILRSMLPPGSKVAATIVHVARSGMSRNVRVMVARGGRVEDISSLVARAIDCPTSKEGDVRIGGCGMDMRFAVVHALSYRLHGNPLTPEASKVVARLAKKDERAAERLRPGYTLDVDRL